MDAELTDEQRRERARNWLRDGAVRGGYPLHDAPLAPSDGSVAAKPAFQVVADSPEAATVTADGKKKGHAKPKPAAAPAPAGPMFERQEAA